MPFIRKDGSRVTPASQRAAAPTMSEISAEKVDRVTVEPPVLQAAVDPAPGKNQPTGDYEVGYCRPPVSGQIKPGEVRNPRGRAGAPALHTMVLRAMRELLVVRTAHGERKVSRIEAIVMKSVEKALKGDNRAIEQSMLRYEQALADVARKVRDSAPDDISAADRAILDAFLRTASPSSPSSI
jgi:hypothetical protein